MAFPLTVLRAKVPLTKTINGPAAQDAKNFTWRQVNLADPSAIHQFVLSQLEETYEAVVLGTPSPAWPAGQSSVRRSRDREDGPATLTGGPALLLPVDVDGLAIPEWRTPSLAAQSALRLLRLEGPCVWSATASAGLEKAAGEARLRLWVPLAAPVSLDALRRWADQWTWLDASIYSPASLIYTARPIFPDNLADPYPGESRCGLLDGHLPVTARLPAEFSASARPATTQAVDARVQALKERGLYKALLSAGRHSVTCPWDADHSEAPEEGDTSTVYMEPHWAGHAAPAFRCLHSHCANKTIDDLDFVLNLTAAPERIAHWSYIYTLRTFIHRSTGQNYSVAAYDDRYGRVARANASTAFFRDPRAATYDCMDFVPGKPRTIVAEDGTRLLNLWLDRRAAPVAGDASLWHEHLKITIPDEDERRLLEQWLAWVYVYPERRIHWAPLVIGPPGNGKTSLGDILGYLVGDQYVARPTTANVRSEFNSWVFRKQLVIIEELMSEGSRQLANHLKPLITNPRISVRLMRTDTFDATNTASIFGCSNYPNAISVDSNDRRYMFIRAPGIAEPERLARLWAWLRNKGGLANVAHALQQVDLKDFPVFGPAPHTSLRDSAIEITQPEISIAADALRAEFVVRKLVLSTEIAEALMRAGMIMKSPARKVGHAAAILNWKILTRGRLEGRGVTVYATSQTSEYDQADTSWLIRQANAEARAIQESEDLLA